MPINKLKNNDTNKTENLKFQRRQISFTPNDKLATEAKPASNQRIRYAKAVYPNLTPDMNKTVLSIREKLNPTNQKPTPSLPLPTPSSQTSSPSLQHIQQNGTQNDNKHKKRKRI